MSRIEVGRPINGISLNGLEYLLNDDGERMTFGSEEEAAAFLKAHGYTDEMIADGIVFKERNMAAEAAKIAEAMKSLHENCKKLFCSECPASIQTAVGYRCSLTEYTPDHWEVHV